MQKVGRKLKILSFSRNAAATRYELLKALASVEIFKNSRSDENDF